MSEHPLYVRDVRTFALRVSILFALVTRRESALVRLLASEDSGSVTVWVAMIDLSL